ncbi:hypothetical protein D0Z07_7475 [Hyphodiscus hymeniophilus]|uniref:Uncharacterized protein n=1 Tax=Hyphodiscus hymeniophilus TaxID=353542 RepID=A0A9P6VEZ0_9HELO|nr:hypothetical protein D0Z07_7475 [Hyphodiscus hymeniophilus]
MAGQTIVSKSATGTFNEPLGIAQCSDGVAGPQESQESRRLSVPMSPVEAGPQPSREKDKRMLSVSTVRSELTEKLLSPTVTFFKDLERQDTRHHQGIYWRSPLMMVAFFLSGVTSSVSHHFYYSSLDGKQVGNDNSQQWALRWGTTFAYITQVCLVSSVGFAYTQWLFRTLKRTKVAVEGLDAAFSADSTIISLLHKEMLMKIKVGSLLALMIWCLPLPSLVTPATLYVLPTLHKQWREALVGILDMYGSQSVEGMNQTRAFTYSVNSSSGNTEHVQFLGPRTIVSRLSTATATQGLVLPIKPPFSNATYSLQFYGPAVQCSEPNSTIADAIQALRLSSVKSFVGNLVEDANYYFAVVPDLSNYMNGSATDNGSETSNFVRLQQPDQASNQLWMAYSRYVLDQSGARHIEDHYSVCQLYNASYSVGLTFSEGNQTIEDMGTQILNPVDYPQLSAPYSNELMVQHAYSAVFWALTDLLVGSMGIFTEDTSETSNVPTNFSEITTQIEYTSVLGSSDLDAFFDANHYLTSTNTTLSDQRLQDIALAGNRTLDVLISALCYNTTLSFMNSDLLSPSILTNVTSQQAINSYAYHSKNLLVSYGVAIFFALIGNVLGACAYRSNGVSHNKSFSAILTSTRDMGLTDLFHEQRLGRMPLPEEIQKTKLRFGRMKGGGLGFSRA